MSLFYPTMLLRRVYQIEAEMLHNMNIKALILDIDNTLTTHDNPVPDYNIMEWLENMRSHGIKLVLLSNNTSSRVEAFAKKLELPFVANGMKPLLSGYQRSIKTLGVPAKQVAVVGDQIFTDILGGNLAGIPTILVEPMEKEAKAFFKLKRRLEVSILRRFRAKRRNTK